jgi:hypothetical protein
VGRRRRRRSRAEADRLAAEFEVSGVSREEFCERHGLAWVTLARYRRQLRQAQGEVSGTGQWLAVEVLGSKPSSARGAASGLTVALPGGRRIEVGVGFDASTLQQLLRLLEPA